MDRRNFLKTVAQAAAVAAVAPKSLLDGPKVVMGVDTSLAADCTSVSFWRSYNDLYYFSGQVLVTIPEKLSSVNRGRVAVESGS